MARSVMAASVRLLMAAAVAVPAISRPSPTLARMISTASSVIRPTRTPFAPRFETYPLSLIFNRRYAKRRLQHSDGSDIEQDDLDSDVDSYVPGAGKFDFDDDADSDNFSNVDVDVDDDDDDDDEL